MKRTLFALFLPLALASPAWAFGVKNVRVTDALNGTPAASISVSPKADPIVDLSGLDGETIHSIAIGAGSSIRVDHCLFTGGCGSRVPPVFRLYRVQVKSPAVPSTSQSQLAVTTLSGTGEWNTYIFAVRLTAEPEATKINLIPDEQTQQSSGNFQLEAFGARQAIAQSTLVDPELIGRVRTYLLLRKNGASSKKAARKAEISSELVARIESLGRARVKKAAKKKPKKVIEIKPPALPVEQPQEATAIVPPASSKPKAQAKTQPTGSEYNSHAYANALQLGLANFRRDGLIKYNDNLWFRLQNAIRSFRRGASVDGASQSAGVSVDELNKFLKSGGL